MIPDEILDRKIYKEITIREIKKLCDQVQFNSISEMCRYLGVERKSFTGSLNKKWAKPYMDFLPTKKKYKSYKDQIKLKCWCCGDFFGHSLEKGDDPEHLKKIIRLCPHCRKKDEEQTYSTTSPCRVLQTQVGEHGRIRYLTGEEFKAAAKECTPILEIENQAKKVSFANIVRFNL